MADRTTERERLFAKISSLTEVEVAELLDYVTIMETMRVQLDSPGRFEDELIAMLAESTESRRARTVLEWDRVRRRAERAATFAANTNYPF
jgi:regulator of sigma D